MEGVVFTSLRSCVYISLILFLSFPLSLSSNFSFFLDVWEDARSCKLMFRLSCFLNVCAISSVRT